MHEAMLTLERTPRLTTNCAWLPCCGVSLSGGKGQETSTGPYLPGVLLAEARLQVEHHCRRPDDEAHGQRGPHHGCHGGLQRGSISASNCSSWQLGTAHLLSAPSQGTMPSPDGEPSLQQATRRRLLPNSCCCSRDLTGAALLGMAVVRCTHPATLFPCVPTLGTAMSCGTKASAMVQIAAMNSKSSSGWYTCKACRGTGKLRWHTST